MRAARSAAVALVIVLAVAGNVAAITFGELDGEAHPNVGAMVVPDEDGNNDIWCTGTLVSPTVFVTASHCTIYLTMNGFEHDVYVSFDSNVDESATLHRGTAHTNPNYGGGQNDPGDVAVIVLDEPITDIAPARLPTANLLGALSLKGQRFVTVGYGAIRDDKTGGWHSLSGDTQRRVAEQGFRSLTKAWLNLAMNPSIGSGGTCYGDSGGPHFLGTSDVVVAVTVTGDRWCRSTDVDYRLDTAPARAFLGEFVSLP